MTEQVIKINGMPVTDERMVSCETIAPIIGVSGWRVRRMAVSGEIPAYKIGKVWRFRMSEVTDWLEAQKNINAEKANK